MSTARKILVIDDEADLRESLTDQIALHEEFETTSAGSAAEGIAKVKAENVDLILMDVGLPDMDGREACKLLRKNGFKGPIVMLTGQVSDSDTILGLESGANDYITKPFKFAVLLARIRAQLRQHEQSEDAVFMIGRYTFRPSAKTLVDDLRGGVALNGNPWRRASFMVLKAPEVPSVHDPLDDGSFLYFLRNVPLEIGHTYTFNRYFQPAGNPIIIRVLRREQVTVPAGTFNAIVVQPRIGTSRILSQKGRAEVWLADDSTHMMLQLKSSLPFGSINLYLTGYSLGERSP